METYKASFTWKALTDIFELDIERLAGVVFETDSPSFHLELQQTLSLSPEDIAFGLEVIETLAYGVTQTVDDDFNRLLYTVKHSPAVIREIFTPKDARILIDAFEEGRTPEGLTEQELVIGIYLVLKGGERDIPGFSVLDVLLEAETP